MVENLSGIFKRLAILLFYLRLYWKIGQIKVLDLLISYNFVFKFFFIKGLVCPEIVKKLRFYSRGASFAVTFTSWDVSFWENWFNLYNICIDVASEFKKFFFELFLSSCFCSDINNVRNRIFGNKNLRFAWKNCECYYFLKKIQWFVTLSKYKLLYY